MYGLALRSVSWSNFQFWFLLIGLSALCAWCFWLWRTWKALRQGRPDPLVLLIEAWLAEFWGPALLVGVPGALIVLLGLLATSLFSTVLFVLLLALLTSGLAFLMWRLWPRDTSRGNLFDAMPLPHLQWPLYENEQDRQMREWTEERARGLKADPPDFTGATFGSLVLEVSQKASEIYEKKTMLSVSVTDLMLGLERTAADMKLLTNHLPLTHKLTLADIERQIGLGIQHGRSLYLAFFSVLSLINPGNILRILLFLLQDKSPWQHLMQELQGWVYSSYVERLGYHLGLIYSNRQPPPFDAVRQNLNEQQHQQTQLLQAKKIGMLTNLSFMGTLLYLFFQVLNAAFGLGWLAMLCDAGLLLLLLLGVRKLREAARWQRLWQSLQPTWPEEVPPEGKQEREARQQINLVINAHQHAPSIKNSEDLKPLLQHYGKLCFDIWFACYQSYRDPNDPQVHRAARELYLPQGFAGIEFFFRDMRLWYQGQQALPRVVRQLERMGVSMELLYSLQTDPDVGARLHTLKQVGGVVRLLARLRKNPFKSPLQLALTFAGTLLADVAKGVAVNAVHDQIIQLLQRDYAQRLIDIYGARHTAQDFAERPQGAETKRFLVLARDPALLEQVLPTLALPPTTQKASIETSSSETPDDIEASEEEPNNPQLPSAEEASSFRPYTQSFDRHATPISWYTVVWCTDPTLSEDQTDLSHALQQHQYQGILLLETIDYGARENIAHELRRRLLPKLRQQQSGALLVLLCGVEKLKPLRWSPPYDDYLKDAPSSRKEQRIRNAWLAWQQAFRESFEEEYTLPTENFLPVGIPALPQKSWGLQPLYDQLSLVEPNREEPDS